MSKTVVITGANRGIGLSFVKHYLENGERVYALCRTPSTALEQRQAHHANQINSSADASQDQPSLTIVSGVDVHQPQSLSTTLNALQGITIDLLINNAGILKNEVLGDIDYQSIQDQFAVNAMGPLRITEALLPQLNTGAKIAMITSRMGSIADNTSGGRYGYRMSKAALNIASVSLAQDVKTRGISVAILHPGLVGTDMIGGTGDITPDQAAERLAQRIDALTLQNSGSFWHSNGEKLPW